MELTKTGKIILSNLIITVVSIIGYCIMQKNSNSTIVGTENLYLQEEIIEDNKEEKEIILHITGQVKDEGIIKIKESARMYEALEEAGGLLDDADLSKINLASKVLDGQKIYIPSIYDTEKEEIREENINNLSLKININTANKTELQKLSGIGSAYADRIIKYRQDNGNFETIQDIMEVSGIGEAKFESIKDDIEI